MCRELLDDGRELTIEIFVCLEDLSQPDKRSHDRDINFDRLFAIQNTRKHRYALFCKRVGQIPPAAATSV